jgi:uncharacterized protein YndB with AHSA1/START domain
MTDATAAREKSFEIERLIDAPLEVIWRAWTDPGEATHWLHPRGVSSPRDRMFFDAREGGTYSYVMVNDTDGSEYPTGGTYLELDEPHRLVFTWGDPAAPVETAPVVTVTLAPVGERTRMTFQLRGVDAKPGDGYVYDGWSSALDLLGEVVAS